MEVQRMDLRKSRLRISVQADGWLVLALVLLAALLYKLLERFAVTTPEQWPYRSGLITIVPSLQSPV